jgi:NNP family nitrate/nitrite transporter-like MFS transporter
VSPLASLDRRALYAGLVCTGGLAAAIVVGSRGLEDYDPVLLPYTFGVLFACFAVAYRYTVWLRRPPTRLYWDRGWQLLFQKGERVRNATFAARSVYESFLEQRFIRRRGRGRWFAHFCFAWGCVLAVAVTFPLVFGWIHFATRVEDPHWYRVVLFGWAVHEFHAESITRYVMFNLLNVSAGLVTLGAGLALRRRLVDAGAGARQQFGHDVMPLVLLLAISLTGLMLTLSMHLFHGRGYPALSLVHALVVTVTLVYLPFGKFFHIFQRPAQISVVLYRRADSASPPHRCRACAGSFAGTRHVADLKRVLDEVGLPWKTEAGGGHYADVCPRCRRRLLGFAQGSAMGLSGSRGDTLGAVTMPRAG